MHQVDHLEFTVGDASAATKVLKRGMGMEVVAESKKESGNHSYVSYVLKTNNVKWIVTAPLLSDFPHPQNKMPNPKYDTKKAVHFFQRHGCGVSAIGVEVADAREAYKISTANGARGVTEPTEVVATQEEGGGRVIFAEIEIYGNPANPDPHHQSDTVLRFIQYDGFKGSFLPGYKAVTDPHPQSFGILRMDHIVGNVYDMNQVCGDMKKWTGMHTFAAFSKEDIQTPWTSLNSEVLSSNNNKVLLPVNESAPGKKESQILEYLKAYNGPGVQHIALKTNNVFKTVKAIADNSEVGFEFIPTPTSYYEDPIILKRMADHLTKEEAAAVMEAGILVDEDDEGVLLQIFTKPLFDRPTIFVEIIQRRCHGEVVEIPGCGGFGKGNFKALFEAIERLQQERGGLLDSAM